MSSTDQIDIEAWVKDSTIISIRKGDKSSSGPLIIFRNNNKEEIKVYMDKCKNYVDSPAFTAFFDAIGESDYGETFNKIRYAGVHWYQSSLTRGVTYKIKKIGSDSNSTKTKQTLDFENISGSSVYTIYKHLKEALSEKEIKETSLVRNFYIYFLFNIYIYIYSLSFAKTRIFVIILYDLHRLHGWQ